MSPQRVQRKRTKDWTTPVDAEGRKARYVGRGSAFGNPYRIDGLAVEGPGGTWSAGTQERAHELAVERYRTWLPTQPELVERIRRELRGRDLMCWCGEGLACHVDVLLPVAAGAEP